MCAESPSAMTLALARTWSRQLRITARKIASPLAPSRSCAGRAFAARAASAGPASRSPRAALLVVDSHRPCASIPARATSTSALASPRLLGLDLAHRQRAITGIDRAAVEGDLDPRTADVDLEGEPLDDAQETGTSGGGARRAARRSGNEWLGGRAGVQAQIGRGLSVPQRPGRNGLLDPLGRARPGCLHGLLPAPGRLAQAQRGRRPWRAAGRRCPSSATRSRASVRRGAEARSRPPPATPRGCRT